MNIEEFKNQSELLNAEMEARMNEPLNERFIITDGVMKPDIAAPGVSIASSISSFTNSSYSSVASVPFNNRTYHFAKFSGTSMASPMVAGVVALILDANPYLMPQQVKDIIMQTAREDNYTQVIPSEGSPKWGAGKINAYAAVQLALLTVGTNEIKQEKKIEIYPNPTSSELNFKGDFIPSTIELIDLNGRILKKEIQNGKATISELKAGTYFIRFLIEGKVYQEKIIKL
jgi:hypothetical protein